MAIPLLCRSLLSSAADRFLSLSSASSNISASSRETYCSSYRMVGCVCLDGVHLMSYCLGRSMGHTLTPEETVLWDSNTHRESTALLASIPLFGKRLCHFVAWFGFGLGFWTRSKPRLLVVLEVEAKEIGAGTDL